MTEDLVDELMEIVGPHLRAVGDNGPDGYDLHYLRDDVAADYSEAELDEIYRDVILEGVRSDYLEQLYQAGDLSCTMFGFTDACMFYFPTGDFTGLFVSVDRSGDFPLDDFMRVCRERA